MGDVGGSDAHRLRQEGLFPAADKDELISRRPATDRVDLRSGSRDAHLDAFDEWIEALRRRLR